MNARKKINLDQLGEAVNQCIDNWDMDTLIVYAQDMMLEKVTEAAFTDATARFVVLDDSDGSFLAGPFNLETALSEAQFFDNAHVAELDVSLEDH